MIVNKVRFKGRKLALPLCSPWFLTPFVWVWERNNDIELDTVSACQILIRFEPLFDFRVGYIRVDADYEILLADIRKSFLSHVWIIRVRFITRVVIDWSSIIIWRFSRIENYKSTWKRVAIFQITSHADYLIRPNW